LSEATSASCSSAGVFGVACGSKFDDDRISQEAVGTARGLSINLNGGQTISALTGAFGSDSTHGVERVNVFGADDTDKREDVSDGTTVTPGDKYGWRVGIYNEEETPATVNILGAKLAEKVAFTPGATEKDTGTAAVVLNGDQGSSYQDYARAFALGKDFQIYIGGKSGITTNPETKEVHVPGENESQFEVAGNGTGNVVNIFGAIAPAQYATLSNNRCANSSLTIDKNWTANAYGPLEGLENVKVLGEGKLRTFGKVSNIGTLTVGDSTTSGEVVVYKEATLGTTVLGNGVLKAGACTDNGATTALNNMTKGKTSLPLKFTNPEDNAKVCDVTSITSTDYVNNFGTVGTLTLDGEVTFKVDTSKVDANVGTKVGDQMTNQFQLVKGYITLEKVVDGENTTCGKLELGTSGQFTIADESTTTIDPENRALMFVRASGLNVEQMLGTQFMSKFTAVSGISGLYALNSDANLLTNTGLIVGKVNIYAKDGIGIGLMNEEYARSVNTVDGEVTGEIVLKKPLNIIVKIPEGNKTPEGEDRVWALYGDASDDPSKSIASNRVTFTNETK
ncbi:MAG: hypothetical protein K2L13_02370, partial [Opitutales bacterium]|nr:hypothetical protein [Opitutales bacterium]